MIYPKIVLLFLLNSITFSLLAQSSQELSPSLQSVKIHLQGAEITRTTSVNLPAGETKLTFTGLSPKIKPESIRISPSEGITMLAISNRINFLKEKEGTAEVQELQAKLETSQAEIQELKDQEEGFLQEKKLLENNQQLTKENPSIGMQQILAAANLYRQRMTEINRELSKIRRILPEKQKEAQQLNDQLTQLNVNNEATSEIYVSVKNANAQNVTFTLEYVVNNAGWAPIYDLYAGALSAPIRLKYRALAFNDTGVDWENLPITLSTADPMQTANQPSLEPWYLRDNAVNNIVKGQGRLNYQQRQEYNDLGEERDVYQQQEKARVRFETVEVSELNVEFAIAERYTILADSKPYSIDINEHELAATYQHYAVPKKDKDAFLLAQVTGWEQLQLITGLMNVYRDNSYIGAADLNTRNFNDTLSLSLGRDKKVLVKRVKREELSKKQFLGVNKKWTAVYDFTIKNNHNIPINIEILDQVPISKNKEITVDIQEISNATYFENTGKLLWNLDLKPAESKQLTVGFSVKYPRNMEIELNKKRQMQSPRFY